MAKRMLRFFLWVALVLVVLSVVPYLIPIDDNGDDPAIYAADNGQFVNVDGVQAYVVTHGDPNNPPVLFIHGGFGSSHVWRNNLQAVADAGYYAVAFDRIGNGLSDKPFDFDYSHSNQAAFTDALMEALDMPQAVIVGHSAAGSIMGRFALAYPERVSRMVWVDTAAMYLSGPPPFVGAIVSVSPVFRWSRIGVRNIMTNARFESLVAGFHADPSFLTADDYAGYTRIRNLPQWDMTFLGVTRDYEGMLSADEVAQIRADSLVMWGEADAWVPLAEGERLAATLPNARLVTYAGVGHDPFEEAADSFNIDLIAFLDE